jgi:glycolate oxidase
VIDDEAETRAYECDALSAYRCLPLAVVLPRTTAEVAAALRICAEDGRAGGAARRRAPRLAGGAMPTRIAWCWAWRG